MNDVDAPSEQQVKAALMELPAVPMYHVLTPDVRNASGRVYPRDMLAKAFEVAQTRIEKGGMDVVLYHAEDRSEWLASVKLAQLTDEGLFVSFKTNKPVPMENAELTAVGTGFVDNGVVAHYVWESVGITLMPIAVKHLRKPARLVG